MAQKKQKGNPPHKINFDSQFFTGNHSAASINQWNNLSAQICEYKLTEYLEFDKQRSLHFNDLVGALQSKPAKSILLKEWVRIVDYQFSDSPLSSVGSVHSFGGRFNIGRLVNPTYLTPYCAFYCAEDYETAFKEKFAVSSRVKVNGLNVEDLALCDRSHSTVYLKGQVYSILDITVGSNLEDYVEIVKTFRMPKYLVEQANDLKISCTSIQSVNELLALLLEVNWRQHPALYDVPAQSQIFGEFVYHAGYEGILYPSTKGNSKCLCLFPEKLANASFVSLKDDYPEHVLYPRLDAQTSIYLLKKFTNS